jgi:maltose-binding protein MalE
MRTFENQSLTIFFTMKRQLILAFLAVSAIAALPACTTVDDDDQATTHTTTTTETTRVRPVTSSVESTTVHSS